MQSCFESEDFRNKKNSSYAKVNILEKPERQRPSAVNFTNHLFPNISSSERRPFKQIIFNKKSDRCKSRYYSQIQIKDKYE